ncbi:unnamed protein product [Didymodactylos carnosus]|uniref:Stanniocalcin-like protein n=1 Tax=Didymodactylos carnosus TaxID=1234261 RepID=A0A815YVH3_9BILA|nr:unnamed protein product [Didymodactylos carnosus]CAF1581211.1 unnamed protein product [Didymodactylos carnosus]CAF4380823.1 unnamed protein product [Didymodactylos carnosus]CAF4439502.1 unnamed protein product [Didymodactylos carnosus]
MQASQSCYAKLPTLYCAFVVDECFEIRKSIGNACYPSEKSCENPVYDTCSWYGNCLEQKKSCGKNGYAVNYGLRYCQKFAQNLAEFSFAGKNWVSKTMNCLQQSLVEAYQDDTVTCDDITNAAFDSHAKCYVNSGICSLVLQSAENVFRDMKALGSVYDFKDFLSWKALKQIDETASACTEQSPYLVLLKLILQ